MKMLIVFDDVTGKMLRDYVLNKKLQGEKISVNSFVREAVRKGLENAN
jgi:hypothetical protein